MGFYFEPACHSKRLIFLTMILELNSDNFYQTIASNDIVLVEFYATTCHPCKILAPILESLADENGDDIVVAKVNISDAANTALGTRFDVSMVPTTLLFHSGQVVARSLGVFPQSKMQAEIDDILP